MSVCLFVCVFVRYAFSPCNSYRHQTFHDISLGPEEGRHRVEITKKGEEGVSGWNFTQFGCTVIYTDFPEIWENHLRFVLNYPISTSMQVMWDCGT